VTKTKTPAAKWTPKKDSGSFSIWLCLPGGMYAISHRWPGSYDPATDDRDIQVRSRKRKYLDRLRASFLPELGPDQGKAGKGTDYGHRAFCTSSELAKAMARMALKIDSPGFKDNCLDNDLHGVYHQVWSAYEKLDDNSPYNWKPKAGQSWARTARPEECERLGQHWWDRDGSATCRDCGCKRTQLKSGGYRYNHQAKNAVRLSAARAA
jgi:hypothetical protein